MRKHERIQTSFGGTCSSRSPPKKGKKRRGAEIRGAKARTESGSGRDKRVVVVVVELAAMAAASVIAGTLLLARLVAFLLGFLCFGPWSIFIQAQTGPWASPGCRPKARAQPGPLQNKEIVVQLLYLEENNYYIKYIYIYIFP